MMTPKEKKEYALLAVLVLATFVVIWWNFIRKPAAVTPPVTPTMQGGVPAAAGPNGTPVAGIPGVPGIAAGSSAFLPHGTNLDTKVLNKDSFKNLNEPLYPTVTKEEVGSTNPFK